MKILLLLIILCSNACKSHSSTDDVKLYVGMNKTEAKRIFTEHFNKNGKPSVFFWPSETQNEKWDSGVYIHINTKFAIKCIYRNNEVYYLSYIQAQNYNSTSGRETKKEVTLDSITFNAQGVKSSLEESESRNLKRRKEVLARMKKFRQAEKSRSRINTINKPDK